MAKLEYNIDRAFSSGKRRKWLAVIIKELDKIYGIQPEDIFRWLDNCKLIAGDKIMWKFPCQITPFEHRGQNYYLYNHTIAPAEEIKIVTESGDSYVAKTICLPAFSGLSTVIVGRMYLEQPDTFRRLINDIQRDIDKGVY